MMPALYFCSSVTVPASLWRRVHLVWEVLPQARGLLPCQKVNRVPEAFAGLRSKNIVSLSFRSKYPILYLSVLKKTETVLIWSWKKNEYLTPWKWKLQNTSSLPATGFSFFLFFKLSLVYNENRNFTNMPFAMCFLTSILLWIFYAVTPI